MPRKRCAGKDESEPSLSIGDVSHHTVDPSVGASDKRLLRQPNARIVKDPLAVVLIRRNNVDRIHPGFVRPIVLWFRSIVPDGRTAIDRDRGALNVARFL